MFFIVFCFGGRGLGNMGLLPVGAVGDVGDVAPQEVGPTLQSCEAPLVSYPPPCACSGGYLSNH